MSEFTDVLRQAEQQVKDEVAGVLADAATRVQATVDQHLPHDAEVAGEKLKALADDLLSKVEQLAPATPAPSAAHDDTGTPAASEPGQATDAGV